MALYQTTFRRIALLFAARERDSKVSLREGYVNDNDHIITSLLSRALLTKQL